MNTIKRIIPLLLCIMMVVTTMVVTTSAANGEANISMTVSATEVNVGDSVTVTIKSSEMTVSSFVCKLGFDKDLLTVTTISNPNLRYDEYDEEEGEEVTIRVYPTAISTVDEANGNGNVGSTWANSVERNYNARTSLLTVTFTAKAAGTVTFTLAEDSDGIDGFNGAAETKTLTINEAEPECTHENKTTTYTKIEGQDKHTVTVTCDACHEQIGEIAEVDCSGGSASCTALAVCKDCKTAYGALAAHSFKNMASGDLVSEATCTAPAYYKVQCDNCDEVSADKTVANGEINPNNHVNTTDDNGTSATCADKGWTSGTYCNDCEKWISGHEEIPAIAHKNKVHHDEVAATCKEEGTIEYWFCPDCDKNYADEACTNIATDLKIPVNSDNHVDTTANNGTSATCADKGWTSGTYCNDCEKWISGHEEISAIAHKNKVHHDEVAATCKEEGTIEYWFCPDCDKNYKDEACTNVATDLKISVDPNNHVAHIVANGFQPAGDGVHHFALYKCGDCGSALEDEKVEQECNGGTASCTEKAICKDCEAAYGELAAHSFNNRASDELESAATCQSSAVYKVQCDNCDAVSPDKTVSSGTVDNNVHTTNEHTYTDNGDGTHTESWKCCGKLVKTEAHTYGEDHKCVCENPFTGWEGKCYWLNGVLQKTGWTEIGEAWYYFDTATGARAEGLTRVPYPAEEINGVKYQANASDKAYYEAHKDTSKYSDAETAVFVFDTDGKFVQETGIVAGNRYAVDGCVAWHVGFVQIGDDYYYFSGDKVNGGNVMATGKVYATRDFNSGKPVVGTAIYYFDENGKLMKNEGVVEISGVHYYFDSNNMLARGKGLIEVEGGYIYVRSSGELAVGVRYVDNVKYEFDENGFTAGVKNGIIDGNYYEAGHRKFGLIEYEGDVYYFRTSGGFATGEYYITNTNGLEGFSSGDKLVFGQDGKMLAVKNGIVEEDGEFYYYENNHLQCGAGVVEMTDENGEIFYIYVRSNGQLATGKYWPSIRNDLLESGEYDWGTDGKYYPVN